MCVFYRLLGNIVTTVSQCACHGELKQIDAELPDRTPVRIMQSHDGYHVAVGLPGQVPDAVPGAEVFGEVFRQWWGMRS